MPALPALLERLALWGREVAVLGPTFRHRQPREAAALAACQSESPHRRAGRETVEGRALGEEAPDLETGADGGGRQVPLELPFAPVTHELGQGNAHRAHALAAAAEGGGVGQVAGLVDADERWRQHRAHGAGIDPAVSMPADRVIDRAMIHAGAAADAAQHLLEGRAEHGGAAVVEDDDVIVLRPVRIRAAAGAGGEGGVDRQFLTCRRAGEHAQQLAHILQRRHELLDGREHDMGFWQDLREIAVTLVRDDDRRAGLGHEEVGAGDAHIRREEALAQHGAGLGEQLHGLGEIALGIEMGVNAPEILLHLGGVEVDGGRDDVARQLVAQLDDVFAEIGLDGRDAVRLEMMVDPDLLRDHGLALRDCLCACIPADA
ncbi:MAG: hypothetical protein K0R61_5183 [Microvirga sp.]|nr:hypothetical protein [Microvirga sp.]